MSNARRAKDPSERRVDRLESEVSSGSIQEVEGKKVTDSKETNRSTGSSRRRRNRRPVDRKEKEALQVDKVSEGSKMEKLQEVYEEKEGSSMVRVVSSESEIQDGRNGTSIVAEDGEEEYEKILAKVEALRKDLEMAQKKEKELKEKKIRREKEAKLRRLSAEGRDHATRLLQDTAECNKSLDDATRVIFITLRQGFSDLRSLLTRREEELLSLLDWELREQREGIVSFARRWSELTKIPEEKLLYEDEHVGMRELEEMKQCMIQVRSVTEAMNALAEEKKQAPRMGRETTEGFSNVVYSIFSYGGLRNGHILPPPIPGKYSVDIEASKATGSQENPENCPEASPRSPNQLMDDVSDDASMQGDGGFVQQPKRITTKKQSMGGKRQDSAPPSGDNPKPRTARVEPSNGRTRNTIANYLPKDLAKKLDQVKIQGGESRNGSKSYSNVVQRTADKPRRNTNG